MQKSDSVFQAEQYIKASLRQAYLEAPWRKQIQFAAMFLVVLIGVAMLAWLYLSISSEAVAAGRLIQQMRRMNNHMQQVNADMESQIANLTSAVTMKGRLKDTNLQPVSPDELVYLQVPGYHESQVYLGVPSDQPASIMAEVKEGPVMSPEYTQSWIDWLFQQMKDLKPLYQINAEAKP